MRCSSGLLIASKILDWTMNGLFSEESLDASGPTGAVSGHHGRSSTCLAHKALILRAGALIKPGQWKGTRDMAFSLICAASFPQSSIV